MAVFRVIKDKDNPYVTKNTFYDFDPRLSLKAKGLMGIFLSRPDDWRFYHKEILKHCKDGKDSLNSAINELIKVGYIERDLSRDAKGKLLGGYDYTVYEVPKEYLDNSACTKTTECGKTEIGKTRIREKPFSENPPLLINELILSNEYKLNNECSSRNDRDEIINYYCNKALTTELHLKPAEIKTINKIIEDNIPLDIVKQGIDLAFKNFIPSFEGDKIKSFKYCAPVIRGLNAKINAKEDASGSLNEDNGTNKNKEPGEGELLAKRAIQKYGDKLEDCECDF